MDSAHLVAFNSHKPAHILVNMLPGLFSCFRQRAGPQSDPMATGNANTDSRARNVVVLPQTVQAAPAAPEGKDAVQIQIPTSMVDQPDQPLQPDQPAQAPQSTSEAASSGGCPPAAPRSTSSKKEGAPQQAGVVLPIAAAVHECPPFELMDGLQLNSPIGRGTFGRVFKGTWHGTTVAVKVVVTPALNHVALRETHLGPQLQHPHIVQTYATRCACLTNEYFDHIEAYMESTSRSFEGSGLPPAAASFTGASGAAGSRHLRPVCSMDASGDGFGDPEAALRGDPTLAMYGVLYSMQAAVGHWVTLAIMEFCDMKTLHTAIARGLFLANSSWSQRVAHRALLRTAAEIARGLLHLHNAGVIHGDLKPTNVLLRSGLSDRRGFTAKVADFGAAHVLPAEVRSANTSTWGTVNYMAPEHLSAGRISRATDVHSFGVVLWEMMTQQAPYSGMQPGQVARGVADGSLQLTWPGDLQPPMSELVALGRRCTSRDPAGRPSFQEVMLELVRLEGLLRNIRGAGN